MDPAQSHGRQLADGSDLLLGASAGNAGLALLALLVAIWALGAFALARLAPRCGGGQEPEPELERPAPPQEEKRERAEWEGPQPHADLVLIRDPRRVPARHPAKVHLRSGDSVFLRSRKTHRFVDVQGEAVQATWVHRAPLQELTIESTSGGEIASGDTVHLRALSGRYIDVLEGGRVAAAGQSRSQRSALTVRKLEPHETHEPIHFGDSVCLVAELPTGSKQLGVDHMGLNARWSDQRGAEALVVEPECPPGFHRPRGLRLLAESTKSGTEWQVSGLRLEADVGVLTPDVRLAGAGRCTLDHSGSKSGTAEQAFSSNGTWHERKPWRGVAGPSGSFHLGVVCETPLPVHTVQFVQANPEHFAEVILLQDKEDGGSWTTIGRHTCLPAGEVDTVLQGVGVLGFENIAPWDAVCSAGFLGSGYDLSATADQVIAVRAPCDPGPPRPFRNATAALAALEFWERAEDFAGLDGGEAEQLARQLRAAQAQDPAKDVFGGLSSEWKAMAEVQQAKFLPNSSLAAALELTGDSFLLAHDSAALGEEAFWTDGGDGEGSNMLGMQLMLLRDRLFPSMGGLWTRFVSELYDVDRGEPRAREVREGVWQNLVRDARDALLAQVFPDERRPRWIEVELPPSKLAVKDAPPLLTPRQERARLRSKEVLKHNKMALPHLGGACVVKV